MSESEPVAASAPILFALGGAAILSLNDMAIKFLSGGYPLHQVILIRSLIAITVILCFMGATGTGYRQLRTSRWRAHLLRVSIIMISNVAYFLGLAALPLADAVAIGYVSPIFVTLLSIVVLGEKVGPRRWSAVAAGMLGVLVMMRPGEGGLHLPALMVMLSALCYATGNIMTRRMKDTEAAVTLNFYVQVGFIVVSMTMGLGVGDGHMAGSGDPSLAFLLRAWIWPPLGDVPYFLATGLAVAVGGLMISQAYRTGEAGLIAPFEYVGMPMAIFWGVVVFGRWPDGVAWVGIALICGAGLYVFWRERRIREGQA